MAKELKTFVLNMKSLDQQIPSPILVGAGDANGRTFRIIFTQEAADMFTPPNQGLSKMVSSKKQIKMEVKYHVRQSRHLQRQDGSLGYSSGSCIGIDTVRDSVFLISDVHRPRATAGVARPERDRL